MTKAPYIPALKDGVLRRFLDKVEREAQAVKDASIPRLSHSDKTAEPKSPCAVLDVDALE